MARKKEILNASISLMYLNGYHGTSVKDITTAASLPKGSFYNYFENKEHYAVDALNHYYSEMITENIMILSDINRKPLDRISEFFRFTINSFYTQEHRMGCFMGNMTQEMGNISEIISETVDELFNRIIEMIYFNLTEAYKLAMLEKEIDLKVLAGFIISGWQGTLLRMKTTKDLSILDEFMYMLNEKLLK